MGFKCFVDNSVVIFCGTYDYISYLIRHVCSVIDELENYLFNILFYIKSMYFISVYLKF